MHHVRRGRGEREQIGAARSDDGQLTRAHGLVHPYPQIGETAFEGREVAVFLHHSTHRQLRVGRSFVGFLEHHHRRPRPRGERDRAGERITGSHAKREVAGPHRHSGGKSPRPHRSHGHALVDHRGRAGDQFQNRSVNRRARQFNHHGLMIPLRQPARVRSRFDHLDLHPRNPIDVRHGEQGPCKLARKSKIWQQPQNHAGNTYRTGSAQPLCRQRAWQHDAHAHVLQPLGSLGLHQITKGR